MGMTVFLGGVSFPPDNKAGDGIAQPVTGEPGWQTSRIPLPGVPANATLLIALNWFSVEFAGTDRPFHRLAAQTRVRRDGADALVSVRAGIRDASGAWDDGYRASVAFYVIALDGGWSGASTELSLPSAHHEHPSKGGATTPEVELPAGREAVYFLSGFEVGFTSTNRGLRELLVRVEPQSRRVGAGDGSVFWSARAVAGVRDDTGYWDDAYDATLSVGCIRPPAGALHRTAVGSLHGLNAGPARSARCLGVQGKRNATLIAMSSLKLAYLAQERPVRAVQLGVAPMSNYRVGDDTAPIELEFRGALRDHSGNWDDPYGAELVAEILSDV